MLGMKVGMTLTLDNRKFIQGQWIIHHWLKVMADSISGFNLILNFRTFDKIRD